MTETHVADPANTGNFLISGLREVGRMWSRFSLRQTMKRQASARAAALTVVGQRAWDQQIDLSAHSELRDQLAALTRRAGEISQTATKLHDEKAALEAQHRTQADAFAATRAEAQAKKAPVDQALAAARKEQRTADEARLASESQQLGAQIAAIDAERRAALDPIDAALKRVQADLRGSSQQANATEKDRGTTLLGLGTKLYESGASIPALVAEFEKVASVDQARRATEASLRDSLAVSQTLARGTMAKFWLVVAGVPLLLAVVVGGFAMRTGSDGAVSSTVATTAVAPTSAPAPKTADGREEEKNQVVRQFVMRTIGAQDDSDKALHARAVTILARDIDTLGASAQPEYVPLLVSALASPEPELRAAAADAIGMIGPTEAEKPPLTKLLNDRSPQVVKAAKRALAAPPRPE